MKELIYKNQLLFNNNNEIQHYQKLYDSLNQKQLNNDKLFSVLKINEKKPIIRKTIENNWDTKIHRINKHSYIVSIDKLEQEKEFHSEKSILKDIHTEFIHNKENLLSSQGFIHIKEYALDSYECRCHEHKDLLTDEDINNKKHLIDYKLEF
ncbi:unnamed protein product [Rotaria sordida]|uniref:Uncharacterized protein n=1 Tax=Rotaria sordida TaxID=392033 RepID=A0A813S113_9BILA|nr:unnamed protein product [Rotaria sordida]CAF0748213.1 unnamed protein product [Rotaria sordida]CAF0749910.1 unnamed protein product [Rotaria sordida]CAF0788337.1 unnamed protein product [Rotaria sordida]CAF0797344.1 unnamed protein product [Rotaria sordida]